MRLHVIIDRTTGEAIIQGATRRYTTAEYEAARRDAARGDKDAIARLDDIRAGGEIDAPHMLDDCPECQAALARGERPTFGPAPPKRWPNRPRWRALRRAARGSRGR